VEVKLLEVRDSGTTIICLAAKFLDLTEWEKWAVGRAGYGGDEGDRGWYVLLCPLNGGTDHAFTDPYDWNTARGGRTMFEAHKWLRDTDGAWDSLGGGDVLDVEFILGERSEPKESEREEWLSKWYIS
jgi:hypothetical protein